MENSAETKYTDEEIIEWGKQQLSKLTYGDMTIEHSPTSYDDIISSQTILDAFNKYCEDKSLQSDYEHFKGYLEYYIVEESGSNWLEYIADREYDLLQDIIKEANDTELRYALDKFIEAYDDITYEVLEAFGFQGSSIDFDAFLNNNTYHINLMFATEQEQNNDMSSIVAFVPNLDDASYMTSDPSYFEETADNALTYLIHQQGHSLSEVYEAVYSEEPTNNKFIDSIVNEINDNYYGSMTELTALVSESGTALVEVLDDIAHKKDYIKLSENTEIGLFNEWNGAGSSFEINLELPAVIPAEMVRNVQFENSGRWDNVKDNQGYTVDDVYGLVGSVWEKGDIGTTDKPPAMYNENMADVHKSFVEAIEKASKENEKDNRKDTIEKE